MLSKLALRPHHVWKYGRHPIQWATDEIRRGKEEEKERRKKEEEGTTGRKYDGLPYYIGRP